jgi:hypothetical protein
MPQTIDRGGVRRDTRPALPPRGRGDPVLLATFAGTPPHRDATSLAIEVAFETGATLLLGDVGTRPRLRRRRRTGTALVALPPGFRDAAERALELGVRVQRMHVSAPRPAGLLTAVSEYRPSLVVFAPDPGAIGRWRWRKRRRHRRFVTALERDAPGLLWTAREPAAGDVAPAAAKSRS